MEICGAMRHPRRLLHGVRYDDDGKFAAQLVDQFLDSCCGNRVQRRAWLVHQNDFGADGDGARNA